MCNEIFLTSMQSINTPLIAYHNLVTLTELIMTQG